MSFGLLVPLSCVSVRVRTSTCPPLLSHAQVFQRCFQKLMAHKTRIFFTNQLQYCEFADHIFVLEEGKVAEQGTYGELMAQPDSVFHRMMVHQVGRTAETAGHPMIA